MSDIKYTCPECGSTNISFDAFVTWDNEKQRFVLENICGEDEFCNTCGEWVLAKKEVT